MIPIKKQRKELKKGDLIRLSVKQLSQMSRRLNNANLLVEGPGKENR